MFPKKLAILCEKCNVLLNCFAANLCNFSAQQCKVYITYMNFYLTKYTVTWTKADAAAHKTVQNKIDKYSKLVSTHIFYPFAIETAGTLHEMAIDLTQKIGRSINTITQDTQETTILFQCSPKRKCGFFSQHHGHKVNGRYNHNFACLA